jgi:DNA-binding transcriptional ArsR family regulator
MKDGPNIVGIAALIGDHARAEILTALTAGQALTATELAGVAGVTKQTVSTHLAKLLGARLIAVENQGTGISPRQSRVELLESPMGVAHWMARCASREPRDPPLQSPGLHDHLQASWAFWYSMR